MMLGVHKIRILIVNICSHSGPILQLVFGSDTGHTGIIQLILQGKSQDLFNAMGSMYVVVIFLGIHNSAAVRSVVAIEHRIFYKERAAEMFSALPYAFRQYDDRFIIPRPEEGHFHKKPSSIERSRLEHPMMDVASSKQRAFEESIKRWRVEEDAMEAIRMAKVSYKLSKEKNDQREEQEEILAKYKEEMEALSIQHDLCLICSPKLYASIKFRYLLVTNDEMRDHLFQLLGNDFFPKWKERHQVHFSYKDLDDVINFE
ncbi:hypothetical protein P3S67_030170 [Capsicum chacoense]